MSKEKSAKDSIEVGAGGEWHQLADSEHPPLTTNQEGLIADNQNSLKANPHGPTLLEDFILRKKIFHFDHHERIPERIVHARATGARGYFELTHSLNKYTTVKILTEVGEKTELFMRISTVAGGSGSVDTPRDVPRIDFSNDPLLQGRLFSYPDTQISRLSSPNFHQIPVNAPKCPFANHQRDGHMQMGQPTGRVNYEPNSLSDTSPCEMSKAAFRTAAVTETGEKGRIRPDSFADHYSQARQFFLSQTGYEQAHIVSALVFELSKVKHVRIREAVVGSLRHIDESLVQRIATGLAMDTLPAAPRTGAPVTDMPLSPSTQIIGKMKATLDGRVLGILITDGSDGAAIASVKMVALAGGASVKIVVPKVGGARLADGTLQLVDKQLAGAPLVIFDAVAVILSDAGTKKLAAESAAIDFVHDAFCHLKAIGANQGGAALLKAANVPSDAGVIDISHTQDFIAAAKTRQWERGKSVRALA